MKKLLRILSFYDQFNKDKKLTSGTEMSTQGLLYWSEFKFMTEKINEYACATFYSYKINNDCPEIEFYLMKDGNYSHELSEEMFYSMVQ